MKPSQAPAPLAKMVAYGCIDSDKVNDDEYFAGYMDSLFEESTGVLELRYDPFNDRPTYRPTTARFVELDKLQALLISNGYDTVAEWIRNELSE